MTLAQKSHFVRRISSAFAPFKTGHPWSREQAAAPGKKKATRHLETKAAEEGPSNKLACGDGGDASTTRAVPFGRPSSPARPSQTGPPGTSCTTCSRRAGEAHQSGLQLAPYNQSRCGAPVEHRCKSHRLCSSLGDFLGTFN